MRGETPEDHGAVTASTTRFGRVKRLFSGDAETFVAFFTVSILISSFFKLNWWREVLIGQTGSGSYGLLALCLVLSALAWRSLLRRTFVWADPAQLTWSDFSGTGRVRTMNVRLSVSWLWRLLALGYVCALLAAVYAVPIAIWLAVICVLASGAALAFVSARHPKERSATESAATMLLAGIGVLLAVTTPPISSVFVLAAALFAVAVFRARGSGRPLSPVVATAAGRSALVEGALHRVVRTTSIRFLEPMLLLPSSRAMRGWNLRGLTVLRLACAGALGRVRYAAVAVLLALTVALACLALPTLPPVLLAGSGAYVALMPFAAGLGQLWRSPGKRRWVGGSDVELRCWHGLVLLGLACVWSGLLAVVAALIGVALPWVTWLVCPLAMGAMVRTATKPPLSFENLGAVETGMGMAPVRLITQVVRGPEIGLLGLMLLSVLPWPAALVSTLMLSVYGLLR